MKNYQKDYASKSFTTDYCYSTKVSSFTREYKHWLEHDHVQKIYWENMARRKDNVINTSLELEKNLDSYFNILFEEQRVGGMAYCMLQEAKKRIDFYWIAECFRRGI